MADMIVLINKGKIMQKGNPRELYNDPDNTFTAQFMGTPPMNVFSCDGRSRWASGRSGQSFPGRKTERAV